MLDRLQSRDVLGVADRQPGTDRAAARAPHPHADRSVSSNVRVLDVAHLATSSGNAHLESGIGQLLLSRARVTPPPLREDTLARDRLLDWLAAHVHRRVISVVADTGYGKTTLLADFSRRTSVRCAWLRLEASDREWVTFVTYIVAAVRELEPGFGSTTLSLLHDLAAPPTSVQQVVDTLIAELGSLRDQSSVLILDDYHLVDDEPQVRSILARLIASAPDRLAFVLLSRRRLRLPLGRLTAQGEAVELGHRDLRFSLGETERLFRDSYRMPLDHDLLAQIDRRTEGWAASLQMLGSSVRGRTTPEIRTFVRALSGAEGDLYDYLVEEVMAELGPDLQRFLALTSILDSVTPELAKAIYDLEPTAPGAPGTSQSTGRPPVEDWLAEAQQHGLLAKHSTVSTGLRYHPLLRDLLARHLRAYVTPDHLLAMHLRVARAAEPTDWLTAARHFMLGHDRDDAMRVIARSAGQAISSGRWSQAATLLRQMDVAEDDRHFAVILARDDVYRGRPDQALSRVSYPIESEPAEVRALVVHARIHALWWLGRATEIPDLVRPLLEDLEIPRELRELAQGQWAVLDSAREGSLASAQAVLNDLAISQEKADSKFHAGISRHNLVLVRTLQGDINGAIEEGDRALNHFGSLEDLPDEAHSTKVALARALMEAGRFEESMGLVAEVLPADGVGSPERLLEVAQLCAIVGQGQRVRALISTAQSQNEWTRWRYPIAWMFAVAQAQLLDGRAVEAASTLGDRPDDLPALTTGTWLSWMHLKALSELVAGFEESGHRWLLEGAALAERQGSDLYKRRFALLTCLLSACAPTPSSVSVEPVEEATDMEFLASAEVVIRRLHCLGSGLASLKRCVSRFPSRWLPLLRSALTTPQDPWVPAAAGLLEEFGDLADVPLLRSLSRTRIRGLRGSSLGRSLARRRSAPLTVHDMGWSRFDIGDRHVEMAGIRRKSASLLCFLLTRRGLIAPRDQVLDALWPDLDPTAALNSLNQTLYFLRRDIEPGFDEDISAPYVHFESDMLWLDRELVSVQSERFHEKAMRALGARQHGLALSLEAVTEYAGRFAPEFEYEEWACGWRDLLHSQYLHIAETSGLALIRLGRLADAAEIAVRVLAVDPAAEQIERALIWLYGNLGTRSAAAEQYGHYAALQRSEFGMEPPSLEDLLERPPSDRL
jgi:DNA-binding SARP family transcriptional activator